MKKICENKKRLLTFEGKAVKIANVAGTECLVKTTCAFSSAG